MSDLALDSDGDLLVQDGDLVIAHGAAAVRQDWQRRLGLFKGEWQRDRRVGIDYQGILLAGRPSNALLRHVFETVTRETAGVRTLDRLEFSFDPQTRELAVIAEVTTTSGEPQTLDYHDVLIDELEGAA